jgi:hypothetical protein
VYNVQGISLAKLLETNPQKLTEDVTIDTKTSYIHAMLKNYPWPKNTIETTEVDMLDMDEVYSDTDDSVSSKSEANKQKRFYQRTKNLKANNREGGTQFDNLEETYVKRTDIDLTNKQPVEITKTINSYLSEKATKIVWKVRNKKATDKTTCLCVMLRDKSKRIKQLVFHNLEKYLPSAMHNTAVEMGIGMRGNERMHAEASFLEFLLYRANNEEHAYTHVLGMGCSKKHCLECDALLKLFLGSNYKMITSAAIKSSQKESDFTVSYTLEPDRKAYFKVEYGEDAIRNEDKSSKKFLLADSLKKTIQAKYGLSSIPLDGARFCDQKRSGTNQDTKPPASKRQKKERGLAADSY